jgi:hypothetical protein
LKLNRCKILEAKKQVVVPQLGEQPGLAGRVLAGRDIFDPLISIAKDPAKNCRCHKARKSLVSFHQMAIQTE